MKKSGGLAFGEAGKKFRSRKRKGGIKKVKETLELNQVSLETLFTEYKLAKKD